MNLLEEYITYLKNNPEGYWFKRKLYGIGWVPATKAGWTTLGVYLLFVFAVITIAPSYLVPEDAALMILGPVLGATLVFLAICWRMGEPLEWQWGRRKTK